MPHKAVTGVREASPPRGWVFGKLGVTSRTEMIGRLLEEDIFAPRDHQVSCVAGRQLLPSSVFSVWKYGGAATVPPKAPWPQRPMCTGGPGHSSPGAELSAKTREDTA